MTAVASSLSASRQNFLDHTNAKYSSSVSSSDKKKIVKDYYVSQPQSLPHKKKPVPIINLSFEK